MKQKTVILLRYGTNSTKLSEIEGTLLPELSQGTAIAIDGDFYSVKSYSITINGDGVCAVVSVE